MDSKNFNKLITQYIKSKDQLFQTDRIGELANLITIKEIVEQRRLSKDEKKEFLLQLMNDTNELEEILKELSLSLS